MIRAVQLYDAADLAVIYNYYVQNTVITFEEKIVSPADFAERIQASMDQKATWLVLEDNGSVVGYAYSSLWKSRSAYRYTHEVTVYLDYKHTGKGYGSHLLQALIEQLKKSPINNIIAIIALPNEASVAIHEKLGMEKVAHFSKVGYKFSQWIDVGYWQLPLSFQER